MSATSLPAEASVRTRVMSWPPEERISSIFTNGKRLLKNSENSCSGSVKEAVYITRRPSLRAAAANSAEGW